MEKLLHQLASKQTIVVNVYDTTNKSAPINMYGSNVTDTGLLYISSLDFGDPTRKHEMHCRSDLARDLVYLSIKTMETFFVKEKNFIFIVCFCLVTGSSRSHLHLGQPLRHRLVLL